MCTIRQGKKTETNLKTWTVFFIIYYWRCVQSTSSSASEENYYKNVSTRSLWGCSLQFWHRLTNMDVSSCRSRHFTKLKLLQLVGYWSDCIIIKVLQTECSDADYCCLGSGMPALTSGHFIRFDKGGELKNYSGTKFQIVEHSVKRKCSSRIFRSATNEKLPAVPHKYIFRPLCCCSAMNMINQLSICPLSSFCQREDDPVWFGQWVKSLSDFAL